MRGAALYVTPHARHLVTEDCFLILNEGQEYTLEFQWPTLTETLCPFFQPGFLEHVSYCLTAPVSRQLKELDTPTHNTQFCDACTRELAEWDSCLGNSRAVSRPDMLRPMSGSKIDFMSWQERL